jgi:DNA-binding transcriptional MerR regulator
MTDSIATGFSGPMVCRLTGVTYRQLDYWARTELVTPSITAARGSGSKREYSYSDVLEIAPDVRSRSRTRTPSGRMSP